MSGSGWNLIAMMDEREKPGCLHMERALWYLVDWIETELGMKKADWRLRIDDNCCVVRWHNGARWL